MSKKSESIDAVELVNNTVIVRSKSGNSYSIRKGHCSCKGFSFHKSCRHYDEANNKGLIQLLTDRPITGLALTLTKHAIKLRCNALRVFLAKRNIQFTEQQIITFEPQITSSTSPETVINFFNGTKS